MPTEAEVSDSLNRMSLDELRVLAKKLGLSGCSNLRKSELVARVAQADRDKIRDVLYPSWWAKYHNHAYGLISSAGVILSILFYYWPQSTTEVAASKQEVPHTEPTKVSRQRPIPLADYAAMNPGDRAEFFSDHMETKVVWEGHFSDSIGFEVEEIYDVPLYTDVSVVVTPAKPTMDQLSVECQFGELGMGDSGVMLAAELRLLRLGQRLRLSGKLWGTAEEPVLQNAHLEAVFPLDE